MPFTFTPNPAGIAEAGRSPQMAAAIQKICDRVKEIAEQTAPYDPEDTEPPHYRESFAVRVDVEGETIVGHVITDDPSGPYIELGTSDTPAHRTLYNALRAAGLRTAP